MVPLVAAAAWLLTGGCSLPSAGPTLPAVTEAVPAAAPWQLPEGELGTQSLFRVSFRGSDDSGSFRLTLRLEDDHRYQASAVDPLGRALWSLDVVAGRGLWVDHRNAVACRLQGEFDLAAARLAPLPLDALPALLLGRLPAAPEGVAPVPRERLRPGARLDFEDARGRRWTARLEDGIPTAWTLWQDGSPVLWWVRRGGEAYLSDPTRGNQLRWQRTLAEALPSELEPSTIPEGYREVSDCARLYGDPGPGRI